MRAVIEKDVFAMCPQVPKQNEYNECPNHQSKDSKPRTGCNNSRHDKQHDHAEPLQQRQTFLARPKPFVTIRYTSAYQVWRIICSLVPMVSHSARDYLEI